MKKLNIGIINHIISNKLKDSYLNNNLIGESKKNVIDFVNVVKDSPILQLEFKIFNNIENKFIDNDLGASRYIDNNIKLFEIYTIEEIDAEHKKLNAFISENVNLEDADRIKLYESIYSLIEQSLIDYSKVDVNEIDESYAHLLNYIKKPKKKLTENIEDDFINDNIIEIAIEKYNKKYDSLNENDKDLLQKLIKYNDIEKKQLFETYKNENLEILEQINNENVKDNIQKAIAKIKEMTYNNDNADNDILSLYELKKEIL
jgi:hypothetical protein